MNTAMKPAPRMASARDLIKALFVDAARHRFEVVLFWSLDRLTREGTFKTAGAKLASPKAISRG